MRYNIKELVLLLSILLYLNPHINAQKKAFIRIYPIGSPRVIKGLYLGHTDSAIIIFNKHQQDTISYLNIQQIRTKRSAGHHILIGAILGSVVGALTGLITNKNVPPPDPNCQLCGILDYSFSFTPLQAATAGALLGAAAGTAAGTIIGLTKKKEILIVAADFQNWKVIRARLEAWPVHMPVTGNK